MLGLIAQQVDFVGNYIMGDYENLKIRRSTWATRGAKRTVVRVELLQVAVVVDILLYVGAGPLVTEHADFVGYE